MRRTILSSVVTAALGCAPAISAAQAPFDFDYVASGPTGARPALVFNDGKHTWIQPVAGKEMEVVGMPSRRSGPYIVVPGLPERILVSSGGATGIIARASSAEAWTPPSVRCESATTYVSFQKLRSRPDDSGERTIASIILEARRAERIVVTGHPDSKSKTLAENRARYVRERLIDAGVPDSVIEVRVELRPSPEREAKIEMKMPCQIIPDAPRANRAEPVPAAEPAIQTPMPDDAKAMQAAPAGASGQPPAPAAAASAGPFAMANAPAHEVSATDEAPPAQNDPAKSTPPSATFALRAGDRLSHALRAFLALHGVGLEWKAKYDLEITSDTEIGGADWKKTTAAAMEAAGFSAVFVRENNIVYVTDQPGR
ncbi:hypothetical protein [Pelomicrobium methylotrophicum]|uniref:OmpA-like domain-containing protein n=1 Tax=Pelomicrobium methylotrophicum TaxID=2602750 RepID=A0A5C7EHP7_9PROT|nr:hypothetical protein [Pelomicrobium methylotrophicum]TXF11591.1 hypothetical protein FR698_09635 [Pelomicrobium methylotrophicum]